MAEAKPDNGLPSLSEGLPLGYLYLLVMGIANQSIFYGMIGVNYLKYSDLFDVLISPIALMTGNLITFVTIVGLIVFSYPYLLAMRWLTKKTKPESLKTGFLAQPLPRAWLQLCAAVLFFAYLGLGVGMGAATSGRLAGGESRPDHNITYADGTVEAVDLIGKNANYLFITRPGETEVTIVLISENIRTIARIESE